MMLHYSMQWSMEKACLLCMKAERIITTTTTTTTMMIIWVQLVKF
jgi:hypothetical protein